MPAPVPFCRDCAYCLPDKDRPDDPLRFALCENSAAVSINPVSGARELAYCQVARQAGGPCGPDAKFFEALAHGHPEDQDATVGATVLG